MMKKSAFRSLSFRFPILLLLFSSSKVIAQLTTCINGGDSVTLKGPCSGNTDFTNFSAQCILTEESIDEVTPQCTVTADECGCHYDDVAQGAMVSIGSDAIEGCVNGCVNISPDFPHRACLATSFYSFMNKCHLGGWTFSPQCQYEERLVGETTECVISERECGCVFWQAVGDLVEGIINEENDDNCDVCLPVFRNSTSGSMSSYYHRRDAAGSAFLMALLIAFFGS